MNSKAPMLLKNRWLQFSVLAAVLIASVAVWGLRTGAPTIAIGEQSVSEITSQVAEQLGNGYGEICGEYSVSDYIGQAVDTGLTPSSAVPTEIQLRAQGSAGTLGAHRQLQLDSQRVVFVYWTDKAPSELRERETIIMAIEYQLILEDGETTPEWTEVELEALYPC